MDVLLFFVKEYLLCKLGERGFSLGLHGDPGKEEELRTYLQKPNQEGEIAVRKIVQNIRVVVIQARQEGTFWMNFDDVVTRLYPIRRTLNQTENSFSGASIAQQLTNIDNPNLKERNGKSILVGTRDGVSVSLFLDADPDERFDHRENGQRIRDTWDVQGATLVRKFNADRDLSRYAFQRLMPSLIFTVQPIEPQQEPFPDQETTQTMYKLADSIALVFGHTRNREEENTAMRKEVR